MNTKWENYVATLVFEAISSAKRVTVGFCVWVRSGTRLSWPWNPGLSDHIFPCLPSHIHAYPNMCHIPTRPRHGLHHLHHTFWLRPYHASIDCRSRDHAAKHQTWQQSTFIFPEEGPQFGILRWVVWIWASGNTIQTNPVKCPCHCTFHFWSRPVLRVHFAKNARAHLRREDHVMWVEATTWVFLVVGIPGVTTADLPQLVLRFS